jgi:Dihaem cytochrome c
VVCLSGLFTMGAEEGQGLAARWANIEVGGMLKQLHRLGAWLMLVLVGGHLAGVAFESWAHKENLPKSMVTGTKEAEADTIESQRNRPVGFVLVAVVATFGTWWFFHALEEPLEAHLGLGNGDREASRVAFVGKALPNDPQWREECGSCHLPFHPSLLPARSWQRMIVEQDRHFGVDLALDPAASQSLLSFSTANAAERGSTEAAFKINQSIGLDATPLRITETPYWTRKHQKIEEAVWQSPKVKSKANCAACHLDALAGTFEDAAMAIPPQGEAR